MRNLFTVGIASIALLGALYADEESAGGSETPDLAVEASTKQPEPKYFHALPQCSYVDGTVEVLLPGQKEWRPIEFGRYYPFTSVFRSVTPSSKVKISFGKTVHVLMKGVGNFSSRKEEIGSKTRTVVLGEGKIKLLLPQNMRGGYLFVSAPGFEASELSGDLEFTRRLVGDGDDVFIKCISGSIDVVGRHYKLLKMQAQSAVRIRTSHDVLFSRIEGISGDTLAKIDQGLVEVKNYETGTSKIEPKTLDWKVSPQTNIRIHRAKSTSSDNISVTAMTFDASGVMCNCTVFVENRYEINSGEIAPKAREKKAEEAKAAQEESKGQINSELPSDAQRESSSSGGEATAQESSSSTENNAIEEFNF